MSGTCRRLAVAFRLELGSDKLPIRAGHVKGGNNERQPALEIRLVLNQGQGRHREA